MFSRWLSQLREITLSLPQVSLQNTLQKFCNRLPASGLTPESNTDSLSSVQYLTLVSSVSSLVTVIFANSESCGRAGSSVASPNLERHRGDLTYSHQGDRHWWPTGELTRETKGLPVTKVATGKDRQVRVPGVSTNGKQRGTESELETIGAVHLQLD